MTLTFCLPTDPLGCRSLGVLIELSRRRTHSRWSQIELGIVRFGGGSWLPEAFAQVKCFCLGRCWRRSCEEMTEEPSGRICNCVKGKGFLGRKDKGGLWCRLGS